MLFPIILLSGLEVYLGKYDQHSKYLSQLKESLHASGEVGNRNSDRISSIISSIDNVRHSIISSNILYNAVIV